MKKWFSFFVVMVFALVLAACGDEGKENSDSDASTTTSGDGKYKIGMTVTNQEALFFTDMVKGAEAAAKEVGADLTVFNANNDTIAQHNSVEDFITSGVDAIIVNAIDPTGMAAVVEKAKAEGIHIISVDAIIESDAVDVQIGVDNYESSVELGEYFNEFVATVEGAKKLGVVGALNSPVQNNREKGFKETIAATEGLEIINTVDGENVQEKALTASETLLTGSSDLNYIFSTGEPAFIGAVSAVRSQGAMDRIKLFGWDLSPQVIEGIEEGFVEAVIQQDPNGFGQEAVKSAAKLIDGETVEKQLNVPVTIVTKNNVADFKAMFEK